MENFTAVRFIIKIAGRLAVSGESKAPDLRYFSHTETETDLTEDQQFSLISQAQSVLAETFKLSSYVIFIIIIVFIFHKLSRILSRKFRRSPAVDLAES